MSNLILRHPIKTMSCFGQLTSEMSRFVPSLLIRDIDGCVHTIKDGYRDENITSTSTEVGWLSFVIQPGGPRVLPPSQTTERSNNSEASCSARLWLCAFDARHPCVRRIHPAWSH